MVWWPFSTMRNTSPKHSRTPQEQFDAAVSNQDYSDQACLDSWSTKTVVLTGIEAGQEKRWVPGQRESIQRQGKLKRRWRAWFSAKGATRRVDSAKKTPEVFRDASGASPAFAVVGITWVEPGLWRGRQAHFVRLRVEHHRGSHHYVERVELDVRFWKAGDAIQSLAEMSHVPLDTGLQPIALEMADDAPEIAL